MTTCADCRYRVNTQCRRYPPGLWRSPFGITAPDGYFPVIRENWWCGEAEARQDTTMQYDPNGLEKALPSAHLVKPSGVADACVVTQEAAGKPRETLYQKAQALAPGNEFGEAARKWHEAAEAWGKAAATCQAIMDRRKAERGEKP